MKFDFSGKTAVVTGGTRGIGKAIVERFSEAGCSVIYTGTKMPPQPEGRNKCRCRPLDLNDPNSIESFIENVIQPEDSIDILVNNAGINIIESIDKIDVPNWEKVIRVNLTGSMIMIREAAKKMIRHKKGGKIVNISSIFGIVSRSKRNAYSASKSGLIGLTRTCALDLAPYGIQVNALCPGFTDTELTASILSRAEREKLNNDIPLGRFAGVSEISAAALFLCSEFNSYMTGQTLTIDGGYTIL